MFCVVLGERLWGLLQCRATTRIAPTGCPLCPSDISPASGGNLVTSPGIPRTLASLVRAPFVLRKGQISYAAYLARAASLRSMPRPGLSVRVMVPLWGIMCSPYSSAIWSRGGANSVENSCGRMAFLIVE